MSGSTLRILVTGGTGFVGGAIARAAVAQGHKVWVAGRRPARIPGTVDLHWDFSERYPELSEPRRVPPDLPRAIDAVVHAAACVSDSAPAAMARAVNVGGTLAARAAYPEATFVHISSASVYNPRHSDVFAREQDAPVSPDLYVNAYGRTKAEAERALLAAHARPDATDRRGDGALVLLRPHAVYGPGDTTLLPRLEAAVRRGSLALPGGGQVLHSVTHIDTLVKVVLAACERPPTRGTPVIANVADRNPVVLGEFAAAVLSARLGSPVRVRSIPLPLACALALPAERLGSGGRLNRYLVSQLGYERTYDLTTVHREWGIDLPEPTTAGAANW